MPDARLRHVHHVAVEGAIGVGKTSLVHRLQAEWGGLAFLEVVEENPFLVQGFYRDMEGYAFDTEMFFLLSRFRQQRRLARALEAGEGPVVADYLFAKNRIFAEITLAGEDHAVWRRLFDALASETPVPDLVVYLKAETDVLLDRIRSRSRPFERDLTREYLARLNDAYDAFFDGFQATRLLTIDVSRLDFVGSEADWATVLAMVRHRVATIEAGQRELDLLGEAVG